MLSPNRLLNWTSDMSFILFLIFTIPSPCVYLMNLVMAPSEDKGAQLKFSPMHLQC